MKQAATTSETAAYYGRQDPTRELLVEVQRRVPAGQRFVQEAFTSEHRRPVLVKISDLIPNTFYFFDEVTAAAFRDAVVEIASRDGGGRLLISYPFFGEFRAQQHRLERVANKVDKVVVLAANPAHKAGKRGLDYRDISGNPLAGYGLSLKEGARPALFICREMHRFKTSENPRNLGFFTFDAEIIEDIAEDIETLVRGMDTKLDAFEKLELLHRTTQQVARELESYSRRMEIAVRRARRRPDLLTPARFDRIVGQAIAKMEQLKEIPRRALTSIDKKRRS